MWAVLFVLTTIAALGVVLWVLARRGWRKRVAMRRWPTAPALILGYRTRVSPTGSIYGFGSVQAERQEAAAFPVGSPIPST